MRDHKRPNQSMCTCLCNFLCLVARFYVNVVMVVRLRRPNLNCALLGEVEI